MNFAYEKRTYDGKVQQYILSKYSNHCKNNTTYLQNHNKLRNFGFLGFLPLKLFGSILVYANVGFWKKIFVLMMKTLAESYQTKSQYIYIRTVSSQLLFCCIGLKWFMGRLDRATSTIHSISVKTSQQGIECTKAKGLTV